MTVHKLRRNWWIAVITFLCCTVGPGIYRAAQATTGLQAESSVAVAPGVKYTEYLDTGPNVIHVTQIAADAPVVIKAVPASPTGQGATANVATLCRSVGGVVCINGDFFTGNGVPLGGELVDGTWLRPPTSAPRQVWVNTSNRFSIGAQPADAVQSLGATPYAILTPGQPISIPEHDAFADGAHARTAIGWDAAGDSFFVTVDMDADSKGMSLAQVASVMRQLGATTAINEDGGGSSQMVVDGVLLHAPGDGARPVANGWALCVQLPAPVAPTTLPPGQGVQGLVPAVSNLVKNLLHGIHGVTGGGHP